MNDDELLQAYTKKGAEGAFEELVQRHLPLVYSVALRQVGNVALAEDVAQAVFILLAKKAVTLRSGTALAGWLFRTTRFVGSRALRAEIRRKHREQTAMAMTTLISEGEADGVKLVQLDEAVATLSERDRLAVLLRFYEKKSLHEVATRLGVSEEAAKKRVSRAVEKMRGFLTRRGLPVSGGALAGWLAGEMVYAAPGALTASITTAALSKGASTELIRQIVNETVAGWRWAKIKIGMMAGASAVLLLLVFQPLATRNEVVTAAPAGADGGAEVAAGVETNANGGAEVGAAKLLLQVIAQENGQGLEGVRVPVNFVTGDEWKRSELMTDKDGFCEVPLLKEFARFDAGALKDGFAQKFFTWRDDWETAFPAAYVLRLERGVPIGGQVRDAQGNAVKGAEIGLQFHGSGDASFVEPTPERLGFVADAIMAVKTDADGRWTCALAPAGVTQFAIVVRHSNYVERSFTPIEASGFKSPSGLEMDALLAKKAVMVLERGFRLRGIVRDEQGNPVPNARVTAMGGMSYRQDGVRTRTDGSFEMTSVPRGMNQVSAWAKGFAPRLVAVPVRSAEQEVNFVLNRGGTLPVRMVDRFGFPIPGAWVALDPAIPHNADFSAVADADGRAEIRGVPEELMNDVMAHAGAEGYFIARNVRLNNSAGEPTVRLTKALRVFGMVQDAETGLPVENFKAIPCAGEGTAGYDRSKRKLGHAGSYELEFTEPGPPFRVRIEAEGYEPAMSPAMSSFPEEQMQDFALRRVDTNRFIRGTVVDAAGVPMENVSVALLTFEQGVGLRDGIFRKELGSIITTTDEAGAFVFEPHEQAHTIAAADPNGGFKMVRMHRVTRPYVVQLEPWGAIEGVMARSNAPVGGEKIRLKYGWPAHRSVTDGMYVTADVVSTNEEGRFGFTFVPPGEFTLYRVKPEGRLIQGALVEVHSGEVARAQIGGSGRTVTGKLEVSDGRQVNWEEQLITGSLMSNWPRPAVQPPPDVPEFSARLRLLDFFSESIEWRAFEMKMRTIPLQVSHDGSFKIENVPPGPYRISVSISDSAAVGDIMLNIMRRRLASATQEVVIPGDGDEVENVNLGTVTLEAAGGNKNPPIGSDGRIVR